MSNLLCGADLRLSRAAIGLSQAKLSAISGVTQAKISAFERGLPNPRLTSTEVSELFSIVANLDVTKVDALRKKRFRSVADGVSVMDTLPRRGYSISERNSAYLESLSELEFNFISQANSFYRPKAVSFFAGCGGLCYGMQAAGFEIIGTNELVEDFKAIYQLNFPQASFLPNDIRSITKDDLSPYKGVDLMVGGPPCQGFSLAGKRNVNDVRNTLFESYLAIADIIKPKVILMENVRLLTSMKDPDGAFVKDRIIEVFKRHGYLSNFYELNAKDFGVPQHRERVFFVGVRKDLRKLPLEPLPCSEKYPFTFADAVSDLEFIESSEKSKNDPHHKAVKHPEHVLRWLVNVPEGKSAHDNINENLRPPSGYNTTYKRQVWNEPGGTVTTTYSMISGCRNVHPIATRSLTNREALRLQSFPDSFKLVGKLGDIRTTIGNAVPPKMAYEIGKHVLENYIL